MYTEDLAVQQAHEQSGHAPKAKSYPVQWIKVVEKLDEAPFRRKHMFQAVIVPSGPSVYVPTTPSIITLYLQAGVSTSWVHSSLCLSGWCP